MEIRSSPFLTQPGTLCLDVAADDSQLTVQGALSLPVQSAVEEASAALQAQLTTAQLRVEQLQAAAAAAGPAPAATLPPAGSSTPRASRPTGSRLQVTPLPRRQVQPRQSSAAISTRAGVARHGAVGLPPLLCASGRWMIAAGLTAVVGAVAGVGLNRSKQASAGRQQVPE